MQSPTGRVGSGLRFGRYGFAGRFSRPSARAVVPSGGLSVRLFPAVLALLVLAIAVGTAGQTAAQQPLTGEEQAALVIASARRMYQEGNYPAAIERFREYLAKYGGNKDMAAARYGLGLALFEGPREYQAAIDTLSQVTGADFPDRANALYYIGLAYRSLGRNEQAQAALKPKESAQHLQNARQRFEQAAPQFAAAATAFAARLPVQIEGDSKPAETKPATGTKPAAAPKPVAESKPPAEPKQPADSKPLSLDAEWYVRARCDEAEMLLELGKQAEARAIVDTLASNPQLAGTRFRDTVLYYQGYAAFAQKDYLAAGRALGELAPFDNPAIGLHARYLLARTHHLANRRPEAVAQYQAILAAYEEQKKTAPQLLQNALQLKDNPAERQRLESLVKDPPPDYVARASFYWGVLLDEEGKYGEALARFTPFAQQYSKHPLAQEAQFREGICQMQLGQFAEGTKNLQPFADHPQLADQARLWLGRASVRGADPANPPAYEQQVRAGIEWLRKAAEKTGERPGSDPAARVRRGDILIELGDAQQLIKQHREAAATYQSASGENNNPDRVEEALARQATALHLATQYPESDQVCQKFMTDFPRSPLLPVVMFRFAENALLVGNQAAVNPNIGNREVELARLFGEAIKRYQTLIDRFPEFESVPVARQGIGLSLYRLGKFDEAAARLAEIPESDRSGPLANVSYILADCLIRTLPTDSADALTAAALMQQLEDAVKLLQNFLASEAKSPYVPDALLKLGYCQQQMAGLIVDPQLRNQALATARAAYEKIIQQYATNPAMPYAVFERAKCMEQTGELPTAIGEFNRFASDPLAKSQIAPLALLRLATIWRAQKKAPDAAVLLGQVRQQHEGHLQGDPARRDWIPLLQYQHGLAVKESGKLTEARQIFEHVTRQYPDRPEAIEAAWRAGQCRKEEGLAKLDAARKVFDQPNPPNDQRNAANGARDEAARHPDRSRRLPARTSRSGRPEVRRQRGASAAALRGGLVQPAGRGGPDRLGPLPDGKRGLGQAPAASPQCPAGAGSAGPAGAGDSAVGHSAATRRAAGPRRIPGPGRRECRRSAGAGSSARMGRVAGPARSAGGGDQGAQGRDRKGAAGRTGRADAIAAGQCLSGQGRTARGLAAVRDSGQGRKEPPGRRSPRPGRRMLLPPAGLAACRRAALAVPRPWPAAEFVRHQRSGAAPLGASPGPAQAVGREPQVAGSGLRPLRSEPLGR